MMPKLNQLFHKVTLNCGTTITDSSARKVPFHDTTNSDNMNPSFSGNKFTIDLDTKMKFLLNNNCVHQDGT